MAGRIDTAFAKAKAENRGSLGVFTVSYTHLTLPTNREV